MRFALVALVSLASFSRLGCNPGGDACADGGACVAQIDISMPALPASDFANQPLAGKACVNGANCTTFTVSLVNGKVSCVPASGNGAQCTGFTNSFSLVIPTGSAGNAESQPVHVTLTDKQQKVVFDKTGAALGGPPLGCGDCWAGYVSF